VILGQDRRSPQFRAAMDSGSLHHAWLLAGPRGRGQGELRRAAATRCSPRRRAAGRPARARHARRPPDRPADRGGSHPDFRCSSASREPQEGRARRNISVDQVRKLASCSTSRRPVAWRAASSTASTTSSRQGANALLKMLEEPPAN
jgi:DNA polymerase-3 subunit delta'